MTVKKLNMEDVKINNRGSLLRLLYNQPPMSRIEIAERLNLTTASVSIITSDFLAQNLVIQQNEEPTDEHKVGRKANPITLNYNYKYVLTINIHFLECTINILNLNGDKISGISIPTVYDDDESILLGDIVQACIQLIWSISLSPTSFLGAGVTIVGPVNSKKGVSYSSLGIFTKQVNIKKHLEKSLNMPVCVESNVCAYLGSKFFLQELDSKLNVLAIKWGPGVGSASFLNGRIFKGNNFESTEIGHCTSISSREKCKCGKVGCLETIMSVDKLIKVINTLLNDNENQDIILVSQKHGAPTAENIVSYLECQSKPLDEYVDKCCKELAFHISNAISLLNPDKILLLGDIFNVQSISRRLINYVVNLNSSINEDYFIIDSSGTKIDYQGALGIAIEKLLFRKGGA